MAFRCETPVRQQAPRLRQARRCQSFFDTNQSLLWIRTAVHELRRTSRFEIDTRESAAPLVIVVDTLMLFCFVRAKLRGGGFLELSFIVPCRNAVLWSIHCIVVCEKRNSNFGNHCREICLVGQVGQKFAKSRWVVEQKVVIKGQMQRDI